MHEFQEACFSLKINRQLTDFTLMQKSYCAWNTDTTMSRKLNWIIKKIILYICVAGFSSKTPTGRENCSLICMILSNFPRNINYCYCCYQQRQQRRLAIMTSKCSKWNNSLSELSIIIHWEISANHCWKCNKFSFITQRTRNVKTSQQRRCNVLMPHCINTMFPLGSFFLFFFFFFVL